MQAVLDQILDGPLLIAVDRPDEINSTWQQFQRLLENGYHLDEFLGTVR